MINLLLITSLFACVLSFHNTLNRYFFALGREGLAFKMLGKVYSKHGSPHVAGMLQTATAALVLLLFIVFGADPYTVVFSWMSALAVIGILAVQVLVSVAILMFFRKVKTSHGVWTTVVAPLIGLAGLLGALALVIANLSLLSGSESLIVKSFPYLIALVGLLGGAFVMQIRKAKPELYASLGKACPVALGWADKIYRRWPDRDRLQHRRAVNPPNCSQSQECTLCGSRRRGGTLGDDRLAESLHRLAKTMSSAHRIS